MEGGVRKAGNQIRITAQLVEASSGQHVWAQHFNRKLDDLFAVQDEITEEIVTALDVKLVSDETARMIRKTLRSPEALESYYRGWQALFSSAKEGINEAEQMFEETIRLEPESPVGYAMAAWAYWLEAFQRLSDDYSISLKQVSELAQKALRLEDVTGLPHMMMEQIHLLKGEYDQAIAEAERAVLVRPGCHGAYAIKANILNYLDRATESIELAKTAIRHTPVHSTLYPAILASAYYGCDRHEEAILAAEEVIKRDRDKLDALLIISGANVVLNRIEKAHKATREVIRTKPEFSSRRVCQNTAVQESSTLEKVVSILQKAGLK